MLVTAKMLLALAKWPKSHGIHELLLLSDGSRDLQNLT
jgi:hypothetical protein